MTFDFLGHGDSEGEFVDATIESRLEDISSALVTLKRHVSVDRIGLLGLRLGGTLAAVSSAKRNDIDFLILWEPVLNAGNYIHQCLRSNLTTQLSLHRKIERNREQLVEDLLNGTAVNVDGYLVSGALYREMLELNLEDDDQGIDVPSLMVKIVKSDKAPIPAPLASFHERCKEQCKGSEIHRVREEYFWAQCNSYPQECLNLFRVTEDWLKKIEIY